MDLKKEFRSTLYRIQANPGVTGVVVVDNKGDIIESTFDQSSVSIKHSRSVKVLAEKSKSAIKDLDPWNELMLLRVHSKRKEFMLAPRKDFTMVVIQDPKALKEAKKAKHI